MHDMSRAMDRDRSQGALEYLIIVAMVLIIASVVVLFLSGSIGSERSGASYQFCKQAAYNCKIVHMADPNDPCDQCNESCVDPNTEEEIFPGAIECCTQGLVDMIYEGTPGCSKIWWDPYWKYRKQIDITENSGSSLSNYQVKIILNSTNFDYSNTNSDGSDLRFITSSHDGKYDYWIEEWNTGGNSYIWVEIPSIPASGGTTIYMYYNNTLASSESNGEATFIFWDDFDTADKWTSTDSRIIVDTTDKRAEGTVYRDYDSRLYHDLGQSYTQFEVRGKIYLADKASQHGETAQFIFAKDNNNTDEDYLGTDSLYIKYYHSADHECHIGFTNDGSDSDVSTSLYQHWINFRMRRDDIWGEIIFWDESHSESSPNVNVVNSSLSMSGQRYLRFNNLDTDHGSFYDITFYGDDIRMRKYVDPEPTMTYGGEEGQ